MKKYILATKTLTFENLYNSYRYWDKYKDEYEKIYPNIDKTYKNFNLKIGEFLEVEIIKIPNSYEHIKIDGKPYVISRGDYKFYDTIEKLEADSQKLKEVAAQCKWVLKNPDGTLFKDKKFKRQSDTFASLMIESGYYYIFEDLASKDEFCEKNPELSEVQIPEWFCGFDYRKKPSAELIKGIEVHKYFGAKIPTEKVEVDYYKKIKWHFDNIMIAMNYGLVTKDVFKKMEDTEDFDYKYILVYSPKEYFENTNRYWRGFENLKEDDIIKNNFKSCKKSALKATKYGKTAIAFKDFSTMGDFYDKFDDEYKSRSRMITLESSNRGAEVVRDGSAKEEVRTKALEELLNSI